MEIVEIPKHSNLSSENKNFKYIDIYLHLKTNMKNNSLNCKCESEKEDKYYCIPCKITCCPLCTLKKHQNHILINMKENYLDMNNLNLIFNNFAANIKKSRLILNSDNLKQKLEKYVDNLVDDMIEKLNNYRKHQKDVIEKIFQSFEKNKKILEKNIDGIKNQLNDFIQKNKKFYNLNLDNNNANGKIFLNNDKYNTYFLQGYDILNLTTQGINQIYKTIDILEEDLQNFIENQNEDFLKIKAELDKLIFIETDKENNTSSDLNINSPIGHFSSIVNDLGEEHFKPVKERLTKYNKHIQNFKKAIFKTITKTGNLKEIEKNVKALEFNKLKGADNLFSLRDQDKNNKSENSSSSKSNNYFNKKNITSEDDISLNNPLLDKYFNHLFIELYDQNFKTLSKELQSSHADLQIKRNENDEEDEDDNDKGKVIEGTNEIQIYEKNNKKMVKYYIKLTKNPLGYTKFPIGCRSLLIGDKLYISGGRDEYNEYPNVLIFDRKTQNIKRIMDLRVPRAYHTMVYSDVFNSIMIFGGEGEASVEIFDPVTNRWQLLPELNIPRANLIYYCDSPRGVLYTMFGNEGSILDNKYSDVIEFLDLKNIGEGWNILDYRNKSEMDLKSLVNIYPLNSDLILLYGGVVFRGNSRSVCIFDLAKSQIIKIDSKIMESIRIEAKKSKKLSNIISGFNSKSSSGIISNTSSKIYS
jgi:hypothetical protein